MTHPAFSPSILLLGSEGSGKTVLVAALYRLGSSRPDAPLAIRAADGATKRIIEANLATIDGGDWPASTAVNAPVRLALELGVRSEVGRVIESVTGETLSRRRWFPCVTLDPPGQNVRREVDDHPTAAGIVARIRDSRILILTVDLSGQGLAGSEIHASDAWIIERVIREFDPLRQHLLVVLTKGDLLGDALEEDQWGDSQAVWEMIAKHMPSVAINAYTEKLNSRRCTACCVSAAPSRTGVIEGRVTRLPVRPSVPVGVEILASNIERAVVAIEAMGIKEERRRARVALMGRLSGLIGPLVLILLLVVGFWIAVVGRGHDVPPVPMPVQVDCGRCAGKGKVPGEWFGDWWTSQCESCEGTGKVTVWR